jgi:hypothetical protein
MFKVRDKRVVDVSDFSEFPHREINENAASLKTKFSYNPALVPLPLPWLPQFSAPRSSFHPAATQNPSKSRSSVTGRAVPSVKR